MSGIVFFSPHPDDVEFVLGGTVLLHCNRYATKKWFSNYNAMFLITCGIQTPLIIKYIERAANYT